MTDAHATIFNRPAVIEHRYSDVSRVRFQDNGALDFVENRHVPDDTEASD